MANGLYSRDEIARMTSDNLDELLSYYSDKGNAEGVQRVLEEQQARVDEAEHEAREAHEQAMHDEMIASTPMAWEV